VSGDSIPWKGWSHVNTDVEDTGTVLGTKSFDPYGNVLAATGTPGTPFGYTGEYTDPTGLIYLRARYYDPATGQFLTADPLIDETRAPYAYGGGDPINVLDPSGRGDRADEGLSR
jgi:RHS repeat-associated protein